MHLSDFVRPVRPADLRIGLKLSVGKRFPTDKLSFKGCLSVKWPGFTDKFRQVQAEE